MKLIKGYMQMQVSSVISYMFSGWAALIKERFKFHCPTLKKLF